MDMEVAALKSTVLAQQMVIDQHKKETAKTRKLFERQRQQVGRDRSCWGIKLCCHCGISTGDYQCCSCNSCMAARPMKVWCSHCFYKKSPFHICCKDCNQDYCESGFQKHKTLTCCHCVESICYQGIQNHIGQCRKKLNLE